MSGSIKRGTIFQEALRRFLHISPDNSWDEYVKHLNSFSNCMRISGYSMKERYETIRGAHMRYREMRRKVEEGEIPSTNRKKEEILPMKREKGGLTAGSWYLNGEVRRVVTCQATPRGMLARNLKKNLNANQLGGRILVTEDGGQPVVTSLKKTDPFRQEACRFDDPTCIVEKGKDCALMGCIYEITCNACEDPVDLAQCGPLDKDTKDPGQQRRPNYVGMTSTSVHWRMQAHLSGQRSKVIATHSGDMIQRNMEAIHKHIQQGS